MKRCRYTVECWNNATEVGIVDHLTEEMIIKVGVVKFRTDIDDWKEQAAEEYRKKEMMKKEAQEDLDSLYPRNRNPDAYWPGDTMRDGDQGTDDYEVYNIYSWTDR